MAFHHLLVTLDYSDFLLNQGTWEEREENVKDLRLLLLAGTAQNLSASS